MHAGRFMELTEKERLMLAEKLDEIHEITAEIIDMVKNNDIDTSAVKKKILAIQSRLSILGSYSKPKKANLEPINFMYIPALFRIMDSYDALMEADVGQHPLGDFLPTIRSNIRQMLKSDVERFCILANSIHFDFTKKGIKIRIPRIDFSIFKQEKPL